MFAILTKWLQGQNVVWPVVAASIASTIFNVTSNCIFRVIYINYFPFYFDFLNLVKKTIQRVMKIVSWIMNHAGILIENEISRKYNSISAIINSSPSYPLFPILNFVDSWSQFWGRSIDLCPDAMVFLSVSKCHNNGKKSISEIKQNEIWDEEKYVCWKHYCRV